MIDTRPYKANAAPIVLFFVMTNWEDFKETIPFGVYYGVVAIIGSIAFSMMNPEGSTVRGFIRRMILSVILSTGATWVLATFLAAGQNLCLLTAGVIGFTIDFSAPWLHFKAVGFLKNIFKGK